MWNSHFCKIRLVLIPSEFWLQIPFMVFYGMYSSSVSVNELLYSMTIQLLIKQHLLGTGSSNLPWSGSWSCCSSSLGLLLQYLPVQVSVFVRILQALHYLGMVCENATSSQVSQNRILLLARFMSKSLIFILVSITWKALEYIWPCLKGRSET